MAENINLSFFGCRQYLSKSIHLCFNVFMSLVDNLMAFVSVVFEKIVENVVSWVNAKKPVQFSRVMVIHCDTQIPLNIL